MFRYPCLLNNQTTKTQKWQNDYEIVLNIHTSHDSVIILSRSLHFSKWSCDLGVYATEGGMTTLSVFNSGCVNDGFVVHSFWRAAVLLAHSCLLGCRPLVPRPKHVLPLFLSSLIFSYGINLCPSLSLNPEHRREHNSNGLRAIETLSLLSKLPPFIGTRFASIG